MGCWKGHFTVEAKGGVLAEAQWGRGPQNVESHRPGSSVPAAQNVTVDEVISAYKQACQKLNCRQIPKLLRQLQVCQAGEGQGMKRGCSWSEAVPPTPPTPPPPGSLRASVVCPRKRGHTGKLSRHPACSPS